MLVTPSSASHAFHITLMEDRCASKDAPGKLQGRVRFALGALQQVELAAGLLYEDSIRWTEGRPSFIFINNILIKIIHYLPQHCAT